MLESYQKEFIDFLVASTALTFGDFTTKSGRKTPYFINTGRFNDGPKIEQLGKFYAAHIANCIAQEITTVFGPAYKGIPLCVAASIALSSIKKRAIGYTFNRKETKSHGDAGNFVGFPLVPQTKLIIVEDVITAGTTLREIVPLLRELPQVEVCGVVIAVDRCERGSGTLSAVQECQKDLNITVHPIVTIHQIIEHLSCCENQNKLSAAHLTQINEYLAQYGA